MRYIPTSAEKVEQLKKQAKRLQRTGGGKHTDLLNRVARGAGYDHWHHVMQCLGDGQTFEGIASLRSEIARFQSLALNGGRKVELTDPDLLEVTFILFAAESDAWLLNPHRQECMCLAFHGEIVETVLQERGAKVDLQFHGTYRIDEDAMYFDTALPQIGVRKVIGFPLDELRAATKLATESFEDKFRSVILQEDAVSLTGELIESLLERGFGQFDRKELEQAARDGARYSPNRNSLLYPLVTG